MIYQNANVRLRSSCHQEAQPENYMCLEFYDGGNAQVIHLDLEGARHLRNRLNAALSIEVKEQGRKARTMLTRRNLEIGSNE